MNLVNQLFSHRTVDALGWTIVHSIWQGAAVALGFALVVVFLRRKGAQIRYVAGIAALVLCLAAAMLTFVSAYHSYEDRHNPVDSRADLAGNRVVVIPDSRSALNPTSDQNTFLLYVSRYFNRHLPLVVTVWFLGILFLTLKMTGGFLLNQRLRVHRTQPLDDHWLERLEDFRKRLHVKRPVVMSESPMVKGPITIGHFKPVILLPVGMVTGMPADQVETLVVHELAHIARNDYMLNIIQNLIEIVFFFHPGVRWISSFVHQERENCCDDTAVSISSNGMALARALTGIQEKNWGKPGLSLAASDQSLRLLLRIKRILIVDGKTSFRMHERFAGASILMGFILFVGLTVTLSGTMGLNASDGDRPSSEPFAEAVDVSDNTNEGTEDSDLELLRRIDSFKKESEKLLQLYKKTAGSEEIQGRKRTEMLAKISAKIAKINSMLDTLREKRLRRKQAELQDVQLRLQKLKSRLQERQSDEEQAVILNKNLKHQKREQLIVQRELEKLNQEKQLSREKRHQLVQVMIKMEHEVEEKELEEKKEFEETREREKQLQYEEQRQKKLEQFLKQQEMEMRRQEQLTRLKEEQEKYEQMSALEKELAARRDSLNEQDLQKLEMVREKLQQLEASAKQRRDEYERQLETTLGNKKERRDQLIKKIQKLKKYGRDHELSEAQRTELDKLRAEVNALEKEMENLNSAKRLH